MGTIVEGGPPVIICVTMSVASSNILGNNVVVALYTENGTGKYAASTFGEWANNTTVNLPYLGSILVPPVLQEM